MVGFHNPLAALYKRAMGIKLGHKVKVRGFPANCLVGGPSEGAQGVCWLDSEGHDYTVICFNSTLTRLVA